MPSLSTVLLSIKGEPRKAQLQLPENELTLDILQKYFKKKDMPERICGHNYDDRYIHVFGYKKGKKGTENQSHITFLPSSITVYGDALVIVSLESAWNHPVPFTVDQWDRLNVKHEGQEQEQKKEQGQEQGQEEEEEEEEEEKDQEEEEEEEEEENQDNSDDEYHDGSESDVPLLEEEPDEPEELPPPVKRRRAPVYKIDTTALKDDIDMESTPESNPIRTTCLSSFDFLQDMFSEERIRSLERSLFEAACQYAKKVYVVQNWKSPQFVEIYKQFFRSIVSNLHPKSPVNNPRFLTRILEGEFELSAIPFMTPYEMFPEKWFELKDKLMQREQKILEGNKSRATDQFKCRRCNKRECTYYELQTRSADEPMTIFIMCLNCGKEWRQGG